MALLICQFQKEAVGVSGLLRFSEVVSLFHEFGHVVSLAGVVFQSEVMNFVSMVILVLFLAVLI